MLLKSEQSAQMKNGARNAEKIGIRTARLALGKSTISSCTSYGGLSEINENVCLATGERERVNESGALQRIISRQPRSNCTSTLCGRHENGAFTPKQSSKRNRLRFAQTKAATERKMQEKTKPTSSSAFTGDRTKFITRIGPCFFFCSSVFPLPQHRAAHREHSRNMCEII